MENSWQTDAVISHLMGWGESQSLVRAMILTSTRAIPNQKSDRLSDYDVILALRDVQPYFSDRGWLEAFGQVLVLYRDPLNMENGYPSAGYVVQFADGLKIDFSLWALEILQKIAAGEQLPPEFDAGYRVLLDKDHLTDGLRKPTYQAYIPTPPSEAAYQKAIEEFFLEAIYVAKYLWRDDRIAARYILNQYMKHEHLIPLLEWHLELSHNWAVKTGLYGRGLQKWLRPDLMAQLEATYSGVSLAESWTALAQTMTLFRKAALEVGEQMGFVYPQAVEQQVLAYIAQLKGLEKEAEG